MKSFDYPVGSTFDNEEINIVKKIQNIKNKMILYPIVIIIKILNGKSI